LTEAPGVRFRKKTVTCFAPRNRKLWSEGCNQGRGAGARAQIENQKPELSLKFRIGAGAGPFEKTSPAPGPFLLKVLPNRPTSPPPHI